MIAIYIEEKGKGRVFDGKKFIYRRNPRNWKINLI